MFNRLFTLCRYRILVILLCTAAVPLSAQKLLIPMDLSQTDHLKAYGIAYWGLTKNIEIDWLLNYRAGSFIMDYADNIAEIGRAHV